MREMLPAPRETETGTLEALRDEGWSVDFWVDGGKICWREGERRCAPPEEFRLVGNFRFEGSSNPSDEAIVLALEHLPTRARGMLEMAFGPDASWEEAEALRRIRDGRPAA